MPKRAVKGQYASVCQDPYILVTLIHIYPHRATHVYLHLRVF